MNSKYISWGIVALIIGILYFFFGGNPRVEEANEEMVMKLSEKVTYFKDENSDLCFAVILTGKNRAELSGLGMAHVPCEKVSHLIK